MTSQSGKTVKLTGWGPQVDFKFVVRNNADMADLASASLDTGADACGITKNRDSKTHKCI